MCKRFFFNRTQKKTAIFGPFYFPPANKIFADLQQNFKNPDFCSLEEAMHESDKSWNPWRPAWQAYAMNSRQMHKCVQFDSEFILKLKRTFSFSAPQGRATTTGS